MPPRTMERKRAYQGPTLFSGGFRPFFLGAGIWAVISMVLWVMMISGSSPVPTAFDPVSWHAHELLFGYGAAVVCGFLLTAIPNWTGRLPVTGRPLMALAAIWLAGRVAVTFGAGLGGWIVALVDLGFLGALSFIVGREIIKGGNWRNLPVFALALTFLVANGLFHLAGADGASATSGPGLRLGVAAIILMISLIGGRVVPSFTRNWLAKQTPGRLPTPMNRFDTFTLGTSAVALLGWVALPDSRVVGGALIVVGCAHLVRLARWAGWRTFREPLVTILHVAYLFVPLGFLLTGAVTWTSWATPVAGLHSWLAGAVGLMTLAMMTRASLGHSGRALHAGRAEVAIYGAATLAAALRIWAALGGAMWVTHLSGTAWAIAFLIFSVAYWPILTRPRLAARQANKAVKTP